MERLRGGAPPAPPERAPGSTDLVLVTRGGALPAHQAALAFHSPALRKLFKERGRLCEVGRQDLLFMAFQDLFICGNNIRSIRWSWCSLGSPGCRPA